MRRRQSAWGGTRTTARLIARSHRKGGEQLLDNGRRSAAEHHRARGRIALLPAQSGSEKRIPAGGRRNDCENEREFGIPINAIRRRQPGLGDGVSDNQARQCALHHADKELNDHKQQLNARIVRACGEDARISRPAGCCGIGCKTSWASSSVMVAVLFASVVLLASFAAPAQPMQHPSSMKESAQQMPLRNVMHVLFMRSPLIVYRNGRNRSCITGYHRDSRR